MGGLFSHYQQTAQRQYYSNPANFVAGYDKVYDELTPLDKAMVLFHGFAKKTADVVVGMGKQALESGTVLADIGSRLSPVENIRNISGGLQEVAKKTPGVSPALAYEKGFQESKARPLMFEKLTGEQLQNPDGSVNWDFTRKFIGRAMEAPTYAYAGGTVVAEKLVGKGLLSRVVSRTAANLPFAGVNTAIQAGEQGNTENIGMNFLINALILSGISNVVGEIKFPAQVLNKTISDIEEQIGKITPEQKLYVQDALKQGVKADDILINLQRVVKNEVTPEEVAITINKQLLLEGPKKSTPMVGKGFTAKEAATKEEISRAKIYENYNKELKQYNQNPTELQLQKVLQAKENLTKQNISETQTTPPVETTTTPTTITSEITPTSEKVKVPQSQMPIGTKERKVSRLEARMTNNLKQMTPEQIDTIGLSTYNVMNKAEQKAAAIDYVTRNPENVIKILSGEMEPPKGLLKNSIYVVADAMAHDDANLARKLASLSSTRAGQELSILTELAPDSPTSAMREISQTRIQAVEKQLKSGSVPKTRNQITATIQETVKKSLPKAKDWASFVDSIRCNS